MDVTVDKDSEEPIYLQLRRQLIEGIALGALAPGDHLPAVRTWAAQIGVNMHTVHKAYALLASEGFVEVRGNKGVFVSPRPAAPNPERVEATGRALRQSALEWRASGGAATGFDRLAREARDAAFLS